MTKLLLLGLAGALGTLARYGIAEGVRAALGQPSAWATAAANLAGCFLFGLVFALEAGRLAPETRALVLTGFMGAFTTFSTFVFDSSTLMRDGFLGHGLLNLGGQIAGGLLCMAGGLALGKWVG